MDSADFEEIARERRVVVLAGSGISTDHPSGLLSWRDFNQAVLDAVVESAVVLVPEAAAEIRSLRLDDLPVQAFSALVAGSFSLAHYLPVLDVLEGDTPNRGHRALASLARSKVLRAVLTTNFDTLIEQALGLAGLEYVMLAADSDYEEPDDGRFRVHKLHGSVGRHETLVDAVSQKLPGLSLTRRAVVEDVCREADVFVVGFSGADFMFDRDYIPLRTARRVRWVTRPGQPVSDRVREVLAGLADGEWVEREIVPCLEALGASVPPIPVPATATSVDRRALIREHLVGSPELAWGSAGACLRVASAAGNDEVVTAITAAAKRHTSSIGDLPFIASSLLRALTVEALDRCAFPDTVEHATNEVAFFDRWIAAEPDSRNARGLRAGALLNRANAETMLDDYAAADADLREGLRSSYLAGAGELRPAIFAAQAQSLAGRDDALALSLLRAAERATAGPGMTRQLIAVRNMQAAILIRLGEYDAALVAAGLLAELHEITGDRTAGAQAAWYRALVATLRGGSVLPELIDAVRAAPLLAVWGFIGDLIGLPDWLSPPAELVAALAERGMQVDDLVKAKPHRRPAQPEAALRYRLKRAEFTGRPQEVVACLKRLANAEHLTGVPHRLLDLATAYRTAAERQGDERAIAEAFNLCAIAEDLTGNIRAAADLWQSALVRSPGSFDMQANLGWALSRLGQEHEALHHLRAADTRSTLARNPGIQTRVRWYLAEHERRYGDPVKAEAMLTATVRYAQATGQAGGARKLGMLLAEWQAEPAGREFDDGIGPSSNYRAESPPSRGPFLATQARELRRNGERQAAERLIADAYLAYEQAGDLRGMSASRSDQAMWQADDGDIQAAIELAVEALDLRRQVPDLAGEVLILSNIATWKWQALAKNIGGLKPPEVWARFTGAQDTAKEAIAIGRAIEPSRSLLQAWTTYLQMLKSQQADHAAIDNAIREGQTVSAALGTRHADARAAFARAAALQ